MNGAHLHLLVNHIPLFGVAFGTVALLWSIVRKSDEMRWAAVALFLLAGVFGWITLESGESAEKIAEHLPGITQALIETHSDAGELANSAASILAVLSVVMGLVDRFKKSRIRSIQWATLAVAFITSLLMARAANFGGQIRHTEIRPGAEHSGSIEGVRE